MLLGSGQYLLAQSRYSALILTKHRYLPGQFRWTSVLPFDRSGHHEVCVVLRNMGTAFTCSDEVLVSFHSFPFSDTPSQNLDNSGLDDKIYPPPDVQLEIDSPTKYTGPSLDIPSDQILSSVSANDPAERKRIIQDYGQLAASFGSPCSILRHRQMINPMD